MRHFFWKVLALGLALLGVPLSVLLLAQRGLGIPLIAGVSLYCAPLSYLFWGLAGTAGIFAAFCVAFGIVLLWKQAPDTSTWFGQPITIWKSVFLAFWIVVPPLWFTYEFNVLWKDPPAVVSDEKINAARENWRKLVRESEKGNAATEAVRDVKDRLDDLKEQAKASEDKRKERFDRFKQSQDVASKAWIGVSTLLAGLYFGKDFARKSG